MATKSSKLFFDKNDYQLLQIVNDVLERGGKSKALHSLLGEYMHPHGIKEMAAARGLRIAYAIAGLLGSFEKGQPGDRIKALRSLRDEVFISSQTYFQKNTARVLLQIMKELVRCRDNSLAQLKLAHDFRMASTGKPQIVRRELAKYHLLEMPEEWNQYAFDDHVHDANTKGRKSPTHLVMDAWIKGIRYLTVVYYNYVRPDVIEELIEASSILDVKVQVGIEVSARFRDKLARFTWEPHGFHDNEAFLKFLGDPAVVQFMEEGREVSLYQQKYVFDVLEECNKNHRKTVEKEFDVALAPLEKEKFIEFVGTGQPSILHLARFIHNGIQKDLSAAAVENDESGQVTGRGRHGVGRLSVDDIINRFLLPVHNPTVADPNVVQDDGQMPQLVQCSLREILQRLISLHSSSKFTLNLSNLSVQDVMELLYEGEGRITHVEAYNLKTASHGMSTGVSVDCGTMRGEAVDVKSPQYHYRLVAELQKALSDDNVISLKRAMREIIWDHDQQQLRLRAELRNQNQHGHRCEKLDDAIESMQSRKIDLINILFNLETFHKYYKKKKLLSRIGSGSTGRAEHQYGMGFVVLDTLPQRARKLVRKSVSQKGRTIIPVTALLTRNSHRRNYALGTSYGEGLDGPLGAVGSSVKNWTDWSLDGFEVYEKETGNIVTLGGRKGGGDNANNHSDENGRVRPGQWLQYLNTNAKNVLKVLIGFVPAFLTFSLTKDWWVLAYFGAFIWFAITGSRNIIQSVLGGGGLRRSPLLPWNSLVSWSRISDSLLYTGFSVPLLDFLVKTVLLDQGFGVTTTTNPILLYSVMGLANGIYISSHNVIRGLPRGAAVGNFFRSILAIPMAILLNTLIGTVLGVFGVVDVSGALQKWAAIISKFASDCVAAVIEGLADRQTNIRARLSAYRRKISQLFKVFSRLDLLFPEEDVLEMLDHPKSMMRTLSKEAAELEKVTIVNGLDLMYFWMYQPRARKALVTVVDEMTEEEWLIFYRSQLVLRRQKEIAQVFVDGLVGKYFSRSLSFYLDQSEQYLRDLEKLGSTRKKS